MTTEPPRDALGHLVGAYEKMLERVHQALERAEQDTIPTLKRSIEQAREKAVELGELTREEAERVASYVERDMKDAAGFLSETQQELSDWLKFDLRLIENRLLEMFANVADRTRVGITDTGPLIRLDWDTLNEVNYRVESTLDLKTAPAWGSRWFGTAFTNWQSILYDPGNTATSEYFRIRVEP